MPQKRRRRRMIELQWAQSRVCNAISRRGQKDVPKAFLRNRRSGFLEAVLLE
jgi:hypothetical protein